jgi:trehalose 6-phosphate synthase
MNPHDIDGLKDTIMKAVNMQPAEAARRMRSMRKQILDHDVDLWSSDFLSALEEKVIRDDS